jgi:hypothetical protein
MAAPRFRDLTAREYGTLFGPYLGVIGGGLILALIFYGAERWHELFVKILDAAIIAGLLGIGIELLSHNKLIQRVADGLLGKLAGAGLPATLQEQIRSLVKVGTVRVDYKKSYRFDNPSNGKITIAISVSHDVVNYGDDTEEYRPWMAEEGIYNPKFIYLEYKLPTGEGFCFNDDQLMARRTIRQDTHAIETKGDAIKIRPLKYDSNAKCSVRWQYKVTMPEEYSDITAFGGPTTNATVELERLPDGFEFCSGGDAHHLENSKTWTFKQSFISGQHIRAWWFKKR